MSIMEKMVSRKIRHNSVPNEDTCANSCEFLGKMSGVCFFFVNRSKDGVSFTKLSIIERGNLKLYRRCRRCWLACK